MAKAVKLADIAERVGVSSVTVSKALSDQPGVSNEMRNRIKQLARELGYTSPTEAKLKKISRSFNIGVIISEKYFDNAHSFYWQMYQEVATKAVSKGSFTMLEIIPADMEKSLTLPKLISEKKVDGLVIIGTSTTQYFDMICENAGVPFMCLDFYDRDHDSDAVITDNFYGMYKLVNHLISKGHKKIAYVGTLKSTDSITDRYMGYSKAMLEHDLKIPEDYVIDDRPLSDGGVDTENFNCRLPKDMPTAFACNCDITAVLLIKQLRGLGYRIPEDISVIGFDNYIYPGTLDIGVTSYEVDLKEMARETINNLLKKIRGENYKHGVTVVEGRIIYKDSVMQVGKVN